MRTSSSTIFWILLGLSTLYPGGAAAARPGQTRAPDVPAALAGLTLPGAPTRGGAGSAYPAGATTCATATSLGPVTLTARLVSDWADGASWELVLSNDDSESTVTAVTVEMVLEGAAEMQTWNMTWDVRLPVARASLPDWLPSLEPGARHAFGFNVYPSAQPCQLRILDMEIGAAGGTPTPTVTPTVTPTSTPGQPSGSQGLSSHGAQPMGHSLPGAPLLPFPTPVPTTSGSYAPPLRTSGRAILNAKGERVLLRGINWFGAETSIRVPGGLWERKWTDVVEQVADEGFNLLRLPYSQDTLKNAPVQSGIDCSINGDLCGKGAMQVLEMIVSYAARNKLYVIFDRHYLASTDTLPSELWYRGSRTASSSSNPYGEAAWIEGLETLARLARTYPNIVGLDLHNEPHGAASWGTGVIDTDWRLAAQRAGERVLAVNPNLLILVEGVEKNVAGSTAGGTWWGGNLSGAGKYPVKLPVAGRLVYSPHDYGPGVSYQPWFYDPSFPDNLPEVWETFWAYLAQDDIAPVLIGEFGGRSVDPSSYPSGSSGWIEASWQQALVDFMIDEGLHGTYWTFNPDSVDTGGYLEGDWSTVVPEKRQLLQPWTVQ